MKMGEKVNVVYGETVVQPGPGLNAGVRSSARATLEEIGEIGKAIWKEVRESKVSATDADGNRRLLARIREDFKDFAESFPLVLRWIVEQRMFSRKALDHYLRLHATKKLESRTAFLELQAEYVVNCWREKNPRQGAKGVARFRKQVCDQLLEEDKQFTEAAEAAKKEADALKVESRKAVLAEIRRLATAIHSEGGVAAYRGGPETPEAAAYRAALAAKSEAPAAAAEAPAARAE